MISLNKRIPNEKYKLIYERIRKQGTVSKTELLDQSKGSVSTMTRTLDEMRDLGLIVEAGFGDSTGGRRPVLYRTNPAYGFVFGLEISRTASVLVLCDLHLNKLETARWTMTETMTPERLVSDVIAGAEEMMAKRNVSRESVIGLGIGAVGPVDRTSGTIVNPAYFPAGGWVNVPIADMLSSGLSIPVLLDNGANMAVVGEYWSSRNQDYQHLLYIHAGVGLRSAMMVGGSVVYGAVDMEDSIGQMIIQTDGPRLREDGNYGSLEAFASIHALERQAASCLKQGRQSVLREMTDPERVQFAHLTDALSLRDPLAVELFTQAATYFGIGIANLLNILHPEKVILGGPLISAHPLFFDVATRVAVKKTRHWPIYQVVFSRGHIGEDAMVIGAAAHVIGKMVDA